MKILMVCLGNICRSPLAEGIARKKIGERGLPWLVDSVGTGSWHIGEPPDPRSVSVAADNQIDISNLRARQITRDDIRVHDHIIAMDSQNLQVVTRMADQDDRRKIQLMMDFLYPEKNMIVPDPYFGGDDGFQHVYDLLDQACDAMLDKINGLSNQ